MIRVTDGAGADISLALAGNAGPIIAELERRGYPVADHRNRPGGSA